MLLLVIAISKIESVFIALLISYWVEDDLYRATTFCLVLYELETEAQYD